VCLSVHAHVHALYGRGTWDVSDYVRAHDISASCTCQACANRHGEHGTHTRGRGMAWCHHSAKEELYYNTRTRHGAAVRPRKPARKGRKRLAACSIRSRVPSVQCLRELLRASPSPLLTLATCFQQLPNLSQCGLHRIQPSRRRHLRSGMMRLQKLLEPSGVRLS